MVLDQKNNFNLISLSNPTTSLLDNVWILQLIMLITSESYGVKSTLLCDWRKKLETSTKAIRCKTKNNCDLRLVSWIFFPRFKQFPCLYFDSWLVNNNANLCSDLPLGLLCFLIFRHSIESALIMALIAKIDQIHTFNMRGSNHVIFALKDTPWD